MADDNLFIADKLDEACSLIEQRGWVQQEFESERGLCVIGAMNCVDGIKATQPLHRLAKEFLLSATGGGYCGSIMFWNDCVATSKEEVLGAFRKASELARAAAHPASDTWTKREAYGDLHALVAEFAR